MGTAQEERDRYERALAQNQPGGATTYPIGQGPTGAGLQTEHLPDKTLPSSASGGTVPSGATPAPVETNGSQAGGGNPLQNMEDRGSPEEMVANADPVALIAIADQSAQAVSNTGMTAENKQSAQQKKQINEALAAQGMNPEDAMKDLIDQNLKNLQKARKDGRISPKYHTELKNRWKNFFQIVPREDFGIFMMDFGFRMMMNSETMEDMGAIGHAGVGALAASRQRTAAAGQQNVDDYALAHKMSIEQTRETNEAPTTLNTDQGILQYRNGQWSEPLENKKGEAYMPSALSGKPPVDKWKIDWYVKHLKLTEAEAGRRVLGGVTPEQVRQDAERAWNGLMRDSDAAITIGGREYRRRQLPPRAKQRFIEEALDGFGFGANSTRGGALTSGGGDAITEKPDGWSDADWETYQDTINE